MALVELTLFGGFELQRSSGEVIGLPGQKERALLAVLALRPGASQSRDKLAGLLWGDRGDKQARDSLKHSVTRLRESLSSITPPPVLADRQSVRLDPAALAIDVALFEQLLRDGTLEALERAATLYRGDLLEGFTIHNADFEDWLATERQRLRHSVEEALTKVMAKSMSARANDRAAVAARRLLLLDPLREVACRTLMQIEAARAQTAQALRLYEVLRERLRRELGVKPEPATTQLYESIRLRRAGSALPIAPSQGETAPRAEPTRAGLPLPSKPSIAVPPFMDARRRWRLSFLAAAALVALVAGIGAWLHLRPGETAAVAHMALPLPDKPSIAVLPFDNLSADPEQGYFVDGMTEDLITDLSKLSGIFVIARNSSWTYKGKQPQKVAEDLGVRYVLEGSVQRHGDQVRINAQLIDAIGGQHLWAERYDGTMSDVFGLQDRVIRQIVGSLAVEFTATERLRAAEVETGNPAAYDALLRGWDHLRQDREDETLKAIASFEKAIELDQGYGRAYAALAAANLRIVVSFWGAATGAGFEHANQRMKENLVKALEHPTSLAYAVSGEVLAREGRYEEASAAIGKAMALAPGDPENYIAKAKVLNASGHAVDAEEAARKAMRLDPRFAPGALRVLAHALFHQEKYQEAVDTLRRVLSQQSDVQEDYATLVSALGHLGRRDGVQDAIDKYNALAPKEGYDALTVQEMGWWWYDDMFNYNDAYRDRLLEGLRKAGVPAGAGTDLAYADYKRLIVKKEDEYVVQGAAEIEAPVAKALHDRGGAIFVDVRAPGDFNGGHIPGAKNLSLGTHLSKESLATVVGADDAVVFSCFGKHCTYSAYASAKALLWGYIRVYRFAGGFAAWQDAGYPTETAAGQ
jgi:adenylate cyclase